MPTVPASKRSVNQGVFAWTIPGTRKKISLRAMSHITVAETRALRAMKKNRDADPTQFISDLATTAADRAAIDGLAIIHLQGLTNAWVADGQAVLGKS